MFLCTVLPFMQDFRLEKCTECLRINIKWLLQTAQLSLCNCWPHYADVIVGKTTKVTEVHKNYIVASKVCTWHPLTHTNLGGLEHTKVIHYLEPQKGHMRCHTMQKSGPTHLTHAKTALLGFSFLVIKYYFRICWDFLLLGTWQEHLRNIKSPLPWHSKKIASVDHKVNWTGISATANKTICITNKKKSNIQIIDWGLLKPSMKLPVKHSGSMMYNNSCISY